MATAYGIYFVALVAIAFFGVVAWPVVRRMRRGVGIEPSARYRSSTTLSAAVIAFAAIGFVFWPVAWMVAFKGATYGRLSGPMLLFAGFVPPTLVVVLGLVYRPHRPYTRGRWSKRPPDVA